MKRNPRAQPIESYLDRLRGVDLDDRDGAPFTAFYVLREAHDARQRGEISSEENAAVRREVQRIIRELHRRLHERLKETGSPVPNS